MVGKFRPIFPMIGKIFRPFSNDWKKFSVQVERKGSARGNTKNAKCLTQRTQRRDAGGSWEERQECPECRFASSDGWEPGPRSGIRDILVDSFLPHPSRNLVPLCPVCLFHPSRNPSVSPRAGRPRSQCFPGSPTFLFRCLSAVPFLAFVAEKPPSLPAPAEGMTTLPGLPRRDFAPAAVRRTSRVW